MNINTVSTNTSTAANAAATPSPAGLTSADFMQMLVAELQNQDPTNPQDSSAFVTQLAQITQVEQAADINTNLQNLLTSQNKAANLSSVSLIGQNVSVPGSQVSLTSGSKATLSFTLPSAVEQVSVQISDANGNPVNTLTQGATAAGTNSITWDGKNSANQSLPSGTYSYTVTGVDASGQTIQGASMISGQVTGVNLSGTTPVLTVNGQNVPLSSVVQVQ
jgi:flagellar basal-body rod modification protein FlgD